MFTDPNLPRDIFGWKSPRLGMDMPIVRYGKWGHALLLFPTAQSDFLDNERFWLIKEIEHHIFAGKLNVFCINTVNDVSWMNRDIGVKEKARRQQLFTGYIEDEVVPHIRRCLQDDDARIGVAGASFGGFHATNTFFRRPDLFDTLLAMSAFFELWPSWLHGYSDDNVYFNNPPWYVPGIGGKQRELIDHHSQIHIMTGQGPWEKPDQSREFSQLLWDNGIWHNLDMWGHDMSHDWPTWHKMLNYYVGEKLGW